MGKLIYTGLASLDGYIADDTGGWDWAAPDEEVLRFITALEEPVGTYLYGRTTYELMIAWETMHEQPGQSPGEYEFAAVWQRAEKIVYSTTLEDVSTTRTTLRRAFDADEVQRLKAELDHDITVSGPGLAASAMRAGLIDEWHVFVAPALVGGGLRLFSPGVDARLGLVDHRAFGNGMAYLRYATHR